MNIEFTAPDSFGQKHAIETKELINSSLEKLEENLTILKNNDEDLKGAYLKAKNHANAGNLLSPKHKLLFLRCELFDIEKAAIRLCKYWSLRLELFGELAFVERWTLNDIEGMGEGVRNALNTGFMTLLPGKAHGGRSVVFADPSKQRKELYERQDMLRSIWYIMHLTLHENEDAQKKGIIIISSPKNAKHKQFDRKLIGLVGKSLRGVLPVRISRINIVHPPVFFAIIFPIMKLVLGPFLRQRICIITGSDQHVIDRLELENGITKLPIELGGNFVFCVDRWVEEVKAAEK